MTDLGDIAGEVLLKLRAEQPVVHCISNFVTLKTVANSLLALGAIAVMAHDRAELDEIVPRANALCLNLGTLSPERAASLAAAAEIAAAHKIPVVFDPVGVGASSLRTDCARTILQSRPDIIRGNGAEIMALAGEEADLRGVDSFSPHAEAEACARSLAARQSGVIVVSGARDFVTDGVAETTLLNGDPIMSRVTGMGCALSAVLAACRAVHDNSFEAGGAGIALFSIAGEIAAHDARGPGDFEVRLYDALYHLTANQIADRLRS